MHRHGRCTSAAVELARACRTWLDTLGYGVSAPEECGCGLAMVLAQIEGQSFLIECRAGVRQHPTRGYVRRQASFQRHGSRRIAVRSAPELAIELQRHFTIDTTD